MGSASVKFEEDNITDEESSKIRNNIIDNSKKLMLKLSSIMDLLNINLVNIFSTDNLDPDSVDNISIKNDILEKVMKLIFIYYSDLLFETYSKEILEEVNKNLKYGIELLPSGFQKLYDEAILKNEKSLKYKIKNKLGINDSLVKDIDEAKRLYAKEIVLLLLDKFLITYYLNNMLTNNANSEYILDYNKAKQTNTINNQYIDKNLKDEIDYRLDQMNKALENVYEEIYGNLKKVNTSETISELNGIKEKLKKSPNKNIKNLCEKIDQVCDVIGIENLNEEDINTIKKLVNKNTRTKVISDVCANEENNMNIFNLNKLKSPCNNERNNLAERYIEDLDQPIGKVEAIEKIKPSKVSYFEPKQEIAKLDIIEKPKVKQSKISYFEPKIGKAKVDIIQKPKLKQSKISYFEPTKDKAKLEIIQKPKLKQSKISYFEPINKKTQSVSDKQKISNQIIEEAKKEISVDKKKRSPQLQKEEKIPLSKEKIFKPSEKEGKNDKDISKTPTVTKSIIRNGKPIMKTKKVKFFDDCSYKKKDKKKRSISRSW